MLMKKSLDLLNGLKTKKKKILTEKSVTKKHLESLFFNTPNLQYECDHVESLWIDLQVTW